MDGVPASGSATVYHLTDPGGKASLPSEPAKFPWVAPLRAITQTLKADVYEASPLSFAILELHY
jgi:hypothetical protein